MKTIQLTSDDGTFELLAKMQARGGYENIGSVIGAALSLKFAVDEQFRDGYTALRCHNPKREYDWRLLSYNPMFPLSADHLPPILPPPAESGKPAC